MCIAIVKPQGTEISDEILNNCFENNSDGAGIAYAKDGKIYVIKGIFNKDKFIKVVREVEKIAQGDILIHCRIATSGEIDKTNCHPHKVNDNLVMIHNGVLDINVPKNSKVSDTVLFIKNYLSKLPNNFEKSEPIMHLIEKAIGKNNKFAFLNNEGKAYICNKKSGIIDGGIWYSNSSYSYGLMWDDDFFVQAESREIYEYFEDLVDNLDYEDIYRLGKNPLINMEDYTLEPFSAEKYNNQEKYITLSFYSECLYNYYMDLYKEFDNLLYPKTA